MHAAAKLPALYGAPIISKEALLAAPWTMAAPPIPPGLLPVIVFSHGLAGMRTVYTGMCCDLASHGYVVAAVEHRYYLFNVVTRITAVYRHAFFLTYRDHSAFASHRRVPKLGSDSSNPQYQDDWLGFTLAGLAEATFHFRHSQVSEIQ